MWSYRKLVRGEIAKTQQSNVHKLSSGIISYNEAGTSTILAYLDFMYFQKENG